MTAIKVSIFICPTCNQAVCVFFIRIDAHIVLSLCVVNITVSYIFSVWTWRMKFCVVTKASSVRVFLSTGLSEGKSVRVCCKFCFSWDTILFTQFIDVVNKVFSYSVFVWRVDYFSILNHIFRDSNGFFAWCSARDEGCAAVVWSAI